jgi:hypothetical protein
MINLSLVRKMLQLLPKQLMPGVPSSMFGQYIARLPAFSRYNIPKRGKIYQMDIK